MMGPRFHSLSKGVIGFRANVLEQRARFKLGQDERDGPYGNMTQALDDLGEQELLQWMRRCNPQR